MQDGKPTACIAQADFASSSCKVETFQLASAGKMHLFSEFSKFSAAVQSATVVYKVNLGSSGLQSVQIFAYTLGHLKNNNSPFFIVQSLVQNRTLVDQRNPLLQTLPGPR